jgi:hypothetical protein
MITVESLAAVRDDEAAEPGHCAGATHRPRRDGGVKSNTNSKSIDRTGSGTMATALVIEEESGTCSGFVHPHNGYYAGDFHRADAAPVLAPVMAPVLTPVFVRVTNNASEGASALPMVPGLLPVGMQLLAG